MKQLLLVLGLIFLLWGQAWSVPLYYSFEAVVTESYESGECPSDGLAEETALEYTFLMDLDNPDQIGNDSQYSLDYPIEYICGSFPMDAFTTFRAWEFFEDTSRETFLSGNGPEFGYHWVAWDWDDISMAEFFQLGMKTSAEIEFEGKSYGIFQELVAISDRNPVPEPQTMVLLSLGIATIIGVCRNTFVK